MLKASWGNRLLFALCLAVLFLGWGEHVKASTDEDQEDTDEETVIPSDPQPAPQAPETDDPNPKGDGEASADRSDGHLQDRAEGEDIPVDAETPDEDRVSAYAPRRRPDKVRSDFVAPLLSLVLPGFDQWWEGQGLYASIYSGTALGGLAYARHIYREERLQERLTEKALREKDTGEKTSALDQRDFVYRKYLLSSMLYQGAGGFSAFHAFRTAVKGRQRTGSYGFLTTEESPLDLVKAPFHMSYLKRSSTYIPLGIGALFAAYLVKGPLPEGYVRNRLDGADAFFTTGYSFNAGTHEEAVFRGWLMPFATEYTQSPFWANVGQSALFALAHMNNVKFPLPQLLLGYHLGNVVQDDEWRLGEAIFIHFWWDVLAFASNYSYKVAPAHIKAQTVPPLLWLPPLQWVF